MESSDKDNQGGKKPMNPVVTGAAGVVIGAAAVAATKILSDKKTRDRITHTISGVRQKIVATMDKAREEMKGKKRELKHKAEETEETLKQTAP